VKTSLKVLSIVRLALPNFEYKKPLRLRNYERRNIEAQLSLLEEKEKYFTS